MAWDKLCTVKEGGGLEFKRLKDFNVSMLAKQGWRLVTNANPLVTKLMQARYFLDSDFLNAKLGTNPSYMWRNILSAQEVVRQGCRKKIGDSNSTYVWKVPWLPCSSNGFLTTDMPEELSNIKVGNLMESEQRKWDEEVLQDIFNDRDIALIKQIPIPLREKPYPWFWLLDEK